MKICPQDFAEVARFDTHKITSPTTSKNVSPRAGGDIHVMKLMFITIYFYLVSTDIKDTFIEV